MTTAVYTGPAGYFVVGSNDMLWAARGILGEGGLNPSDEVMAAYLWAIARRCLMGAKPMEYGACWRAFSQPINPKWQPGGVFCRPGGKYAGTEACSIERLNRREKIATTKWEAIPARIRETVEKFSRGEVPKPMIEATLPKGRNRLSNWASYAGVRERFPWGVEIEGEWFLEDRPMRDGDVVVTVPGDKRDNRPTIALLSWAGVGLVAAAGLGAYLLFKG